MLRSLVLLLLVVPVARAAAPPPDAAASARAVLARHCFRCHGDQARPKSGLGRITDLSHLIESGQIVPGKPDRSPLFELVARRQMPPYGTRPGLTNADRESLRRWIADGAKLPPHSTTPVAEADLPGSLIGGSAEVGEEVADLLFAGVDDLASGVATP